MKREMDLIRQVLLKIEEHENGFAPPKVVIDGYSDQQINYHLFLMDDAGLLKVADDYDLDSTTPQVVIIRMTFAGHEFLDVARSDNNWNRAKNWLGNLWTSVPLEVLKALLGDYFRQSLGI